MGASSSKSAAQKASRAAAAAARPPSSTAAAAAEATSAASGVSAAERQREAQLAQQLAAAAGAVPQQAAENEGLVRGMNRLLAGVQQHQFEVYRNPETDRRYAVRKQSKEEKEAQLVGRLTGPVLKQLLEEHAWSLQQGQPLAAADLARKYGADAGVLERVLRHNAMPLVHAEPDGQLYGEWPNGGGRQGRQ